MNTFITGPIRVNDEIKIIVLLPLSLEGGTQKVPGSPSLPLSLLPPRGHPHKEEEEDFPDTNFKFDPEKVKALVDDGFIAYWLCI